MVTQQKEATKQNDDNSLHERFYQTFPDPDSVGTTEYFAVYDFIKVQVRTSNAEYLTDTVNWDEFQNERNNLQKAIDKAPDEVELSNYLDKEGLLSNLIYSQDKKRGAISGYYEQHINNNEPDLIAGSLTEVKTVISTTKKRAIRFDASHAIEQKDWAYLKQLTKKNQNEVFKKAVAKEDADAVYTVLNECELDLLPDGSDLLTAALILLRPKYSDKKIVTNLTAKII